MAQAPAMKSVDLTNFAGVLQTGTTCLSTYTCMAAIRASLKREQVVPWAPWEIRRSDLDSEPVREALRRLRETGRLGLGGDDSAGQLSFFEE